MPNAHIVKKNLKPFPIKGGDFSYEFISMSKYDKLIYVKGRGDKFFLQMIDKEDEILLKADKITKPTNVKVVQDAIKYFIEANEMEIIQSNIFSTRNHLNKKSPFQKDIFFYQDFKPDANIEIEIGFGSGRHILYRAKENPDTIFIGIEIHKPSIEQLLKQCEFQNIKNIFVIDYDARILLQTLLSNIVDKIYLHFPVPWDKKSHRRVISKSFINEAIRVLKPGGKFELRTDSQNYFEYSYDLFISLKQSEIIVKKNIDIDIVSKYEDRWKKMEKNIYDIIFINQELSEEKEIFEISGFDKKVNFSKLYKKFKNHTIREEDCFVHFENIYKTDDNNGIIQLSFGSYGKSEHRYLLINEKVTYLPSKILPTKQNIYADKIIKEFIYE